MGSESVSKHLTSHQQNAVVVLDAAVKGVATTIVAAVASNSSRALLCT